MSFFIFNNKDSRNMGVIVRNLPPLVKPVRRTKSITIPGRNGNLYIDESEEGIYDTYVASIPCFLKSSRKC